MQRVRYRSFDGIHWGEVEGGYIQQLTGMLGRPSGHTVPLSDVTLLPPCEPGIIICVGRNYVRHIREMGRDVPKEPGLFLKGINTLRGPGDDVPYPSWTNDLQHEGELAVVISRSMRDIDVEEAFEYVLGYTCALDVTARDRQNSDLQWVRGKSADGFCPVGPWLETDLDPSKLRVSTRVNGEVRQDSDTGHMIFSVPEILSYISRFMTLEPGDLVLTGTPEGVGPLAVGDSVEVEVEGVGTLINEVVAG
ncbi:MAG: fumarylacetoacetate hydrolase family protein [Deinococcales bacterium]